MIAEHEQHQLVVHKHLQVNDRQKFLVNRKLDWDVEVRWLEHLELSVVREPMGRHSRRSAWIDSHDDEEQTYPRSPTCGSPGCPNSVCKLHQSFSVYYCSFQGIAREKRSLLRATLPEAPECDVSKTMMARMVAQKCVHP